MGVKTRNQSKIISVKSNRQNVKRRDQNITRTKCQTLNTNYGQPGCKDANWKKGKKIPGKDATEYRLCPRTGREMRYSHYGRNGSRYNWHIDHLIPKNIGGSNDISNLEPVNASKNCSMGSSMDDKPEQIVKYFDAIREHRGIRDKVHPGFKWKKSIIGKMFLVKASPRTNPELATILDFDNQSVHIAWKYTNWEKRLPLDARLFEPVSDGRPTRNGSVA